MKRLIPLVLLLLLACRNEQTLQTATVAPVPKPAPVARDPHSYSRPDEVRVEHIALDLDVDFTKKQLAGTATLGIRNEKGAKTLVLDTNGLDIRKVTLQPGGALAELKLAPADPRCSGSSG